MKRSHSRTTNIFDKMFPKEDVKMYFKNRATSIAKRCAKKLQQRKQRQYDRKLTKEIDLDFELTPEQVKHFKRLEEASDLSRPCDKCGRPFNEHVIGGPRHDTGPYNG